MPELADQTPNPQDDFPHPVGEHPAWSESYYFYVADPKTGIGAFTRMGFRANEGWADGLHVVYLGGDRVAFTHSRKEFRKGEEQVLQVGALSLTREEPFRRWNIAYHGEAQDIADDRILITPRKDRPQGWFKPARLDMSVRFDATADPFYFWRGESGHFEQTGRATGTIEVGGAKWNVDGWGLRDKSWGPRTWKPSSTKTGGEEKKRNESALFNVWLAATFGSDLAFALTGMRDTGGTIRGEGFLQRNGKYHRLSNGVIESEFHPNSLLHRATRFTGSLDDGSRISMDGSVLTIAPTKIAMPGGATLVNEGLARYQFEGRNGVGIAEYWISVKRD